MAEVVDRTTLLEMRLRESMFELVSAQEHIDHLLAFDPGYEHATVLVRLRNRIEYRIASAKAALNEQERANAPL